MFVCINIYSTKNTISCFGEPKVKCCNLRAQFIVVAHRCRVRKSHTQTGRPTAGTDRRVHYIRMCVYCDTEKTRILLRIMIFYELAYSWPQNVVLRTRVRNKSVYGSLSRTGCFVDAGKTKFRYGIFEPPQTLFALFQRQP